MASKQYLPERRVAERYGVHLTTLFRWDHDAKLGFPKPIVINGRKYRDAEELDRFDEIRRRNGVAGD